MALDTPVEIRAPSTQEIARKSKQTAMADDCGFYDRQRGVIVLDPNACRGHLFARMDSIQECQDAAFVLMLHELIHAYQDRQIKQRTGPLPVDPLAAIPSAKGTPSSFPGASPPRMVCRPSRSTRFTRPRRGRPRRISASDGRICSLPLIMCSRPDTWANVVLRLMALQACWVRTSITRRYWRQTRHLKATEPSPLAPATQPVDGEIATSRSLPSVPAVVESHEPGGDVKYSEFPWASSIGDLTMMPPLPLDYLDAMAYALPSRVLRT